MGLCNDQRKCGCYVFNGLVISAVSLAMIIIGVVNIRKDWDPEQAPEDVAADIAKNACETLVPAWHIVGGFMILIGLLGRVILAKCCDGCGTCCDDSKGGQVGGAVCKLGATVVYDLVYLGVMAVWLIVGTVWILPIYSDVIKNNVGEDVSNALDTVGEQLGETGLAGPTTSAPADGTNEECDQVLFHFTAGILAVGWVIVALAATFILLCKCLYSILCCKPCKNTREGGVHV
eukprot:TRINITY_DN3121_c0_g1_i1.p1 TRINITY_DN3121_c0_g1~~TRINITY_DN3121_c0_g1_i1.p1  ORF type:complete len:233 (+),score=42.79 TRINITY_DN3121_c0_g1_i1:118-816(+)